MKQKVKIALRLGELSDAGVGYYIDVAKTKLLLTGKLKLENLTEKDLSFSMSRKGEQHDIQRMSEEDDTFARSVGQIF